MQVSPMHSFRGIWLGAVLALGGSLHAGCAEERDPISRVQIGAMPKSFFVGPNLADRSDDPEFFMRTTVIDVDSGASGEGLFTSSDAQPTVRIRWEITEKLLLARLTYERIKDTDFEGAKRSNNGQLVASYEIKKHFDVRRQYNETTGEEANVILENDTDRTWQEREYIRVDWSKNLVVDAYDLDTISQLGLYGVKMSPVAYDVTDPNDGDAPLFKPEEGYLDVTNKAYAKPEMIHDPDWGDFPACWLVGAAPMANCNPSEVKMRQSFLRIAERDYEPLDFDGVRMDMFGWFTVDRHGYDRRYGVVDDHWHRFATRWNLFEQTHVEPPVPCATPDTTKPGQDPHRDEDQNGTEDECEKVGRGSRCDAFVGKCTVPLRDRKVRTIPWHVNAGFDPELFEPTARALGSWSEAARVAIVAGRVAECRRSQGANCDAEMNWPAQWADDYVPPVGNEKPSEVPEVFVLCHNPVAKGDAAACGAEGTSPRLGDLRFNIANLVQKPQLMSPWGIMVDAEDPLTGEKISGNVALWAATLDHAASNLVDVLSLLNGQKSPDAFIQGKDVSDWVQAQRPGGTAERGSTMNASEFQARAQAFSPDVLLPYVGSAKPSRLPLPLRRKARMDALQARGALGPGNASLDARVRALRGTSIEAKLVGPNMLQAAGGDPRTDLSGAQALVSKASPLGQLSPAFRKAHDRARRLAEVRRHSCRMDAADPDHLISLARVAARLFPLPPAGDTERRVEHEKAVFSWARKEYAAGVWAHEFGHSMGLRHNFAGSFDSLNYHPQYWQLRTRNGQVREACAPGTVDGANCIGPRYKDPLASDELDGNIGRYATSSVMDYPGDENQDQMLVGKYDRAAMRFGYAQVADVWDGNGLSVTGDGEKTRAYKLLAFTQSPGLFGMYSFPSPQGSFQYLHYSQYQNEFGLIGGCAPSDEPDAVLGQKCAEHPMDVVDYRDLKNFAADPAYAQYDWAHYTRAIDARGRVRRGYMFSSDEYADSGNVPSFRSDAGADPYEQVRFLESAYENRYVLYAFRRGRVSFNSYDVVARMQGRYLDPIQQIAKTFAFGAMLDGEPTAPTQEMLADGRYGPLQMASTVALDLFGRMMMRPEPGYFCDPTQDNCAGVQPDGLDQELFSADPAPIDLDKASNPYAFRLGIGTGRYVHNEFDYQKGYWWSEYQSQVGAYYEKIWSTYYLSEAYDQFISNSKEDFVDGRFKNVNFATIYPEQVRRLFANTLTGDYTAYAPCVAPAPKTSPMQASGVTYPAWYGASGFGARPQGCRLVDPNYGFNEQVYAMVWGALFFPTTWSQSWIHDARITTMAADQVGWTRAETMTFVDPETGVTYRAHATGVEDVFGTPRQKSIGARMLEWANSLLEIAYRVETDNQGNVLLNPDGTAKLRLGPDGRPQRNPDYPTAFTTLRRFVDQLDVMRQLTATFQRSLDDGSLPNH